MQFRRQNRWLLRISIGTRLARNPYWQQVSQGCSQSKLLYRTLLFIQAQWEQPSDYQRPSPEAWHCRLQCSNGSQGVAVDTFQGLTCLDRLKH